MPRRRRRGAPAQAVLALAALGRVHGSPVAEAPFTNRLDAMGSPDANKPDIALIMADDVMRLSLGAYANNSIMKGLTPHLNALAEREGAVAVQKAYCISAICTPSRLSVLTGRYLSAIYEDKVPAGKGGADLVASVQFSGGPQADKFEEMKGLPKMIKQVGYLTAFYGKWHMELPEMTARFALQACHKYLSANMTADLTRKLAAIHKLDVMHEDESEVSAAILGQPCLSQIVKRQGGFDYAAEILADNDAVYAGGHRPECMADRAMGFVRKARAAKQPLFLWFAPTLPHSPEDFMKVLAQHPKPCLDQEPVPEHEMAVWVERRRTTLQRLLGVHADAKAAQEMLPAPHEGAAWLDITLEPLLQELDGPNTLIIFTGDHGSAWTGKGSLYEGGVRVPMLMHWTAHAGCAAWADSGHFTHLDLMPTLATIVGAKVPFHADGIDRSADLFPTAHSPSGSCRSYAYADTTINETPPSEAVYLEVGYGRAVVVGKWKLVRVPRPERGGMGENMAGKCSSWYGDAMPTDRLVFQSYNLHPNTYCLQTMLFNTDDDPWELTDVKDDEPLKVEALTKLLNDHLMRNGEHV
jgi:arylsulfatase A-like enzyme